MPFTAKQYGIETANSKQKECVKITLCPIYPCKFLHLMACFCHIYCWHSPHFSHNVVHSSGPHAYYSTDILARLLETVSRVLWRLCSPAVIRHASAKENISCLVWLCKRHALWPVQGPQAAVMEKWSKDCGHQHTDTSLGVNMIIFIINLHSLIPHSLFIYMDVLILIIFQGLFYVLCSCQSGNLVDFYFLQNIPSVV